MMWKAYYLMRAQQILIELILIILLVNCSAFPSIDSPNTREETLLFTPSLIPSRNPSLFPSQTPRPTPSSISTASPTPTEKPLTIVFYGDSILKIGEGDKPGLVGFSIVDILRAYFNPADQIVTSNHGGRKARWGYENLETNVFFYKPGIVTLWWGVNDLDGCPGIFDRDTNKIVQYNLDAMVDVHLKYMKLQIDALVGKNIPVMVITPIPILGELPWSHFSPTDELVWEENYRCDYNVGLEQLVEAQLEMVRGYEVQQKPVYVVDAWQIYKDHPNTDNMYMDILHPGSYGAKLIAARWLQIFESIKK
jgi:hypothetical protein